MERRASWLAALAAALVSAVLVYGATATLDPYLLSILAFVGINIILAVSLNITNGFTGLFSLGHPAFMTIGGYVTAIMSLDPKRKPFLLPDLPRNYPQVMKTDGSRFNQLFHGLLDRGVYIAPALYEAGFVSAAHSSA